MKLLTFSSLYPDSTRPGFGIFVETRLRHLLEQDGVESCVVSPVPWFPFRGERFGEYGGYARVPRQETRNGIHVEHPRYLLIPKVGMTLAPYLMAMACLPVLKRIIKNGYNFDVIDAHYFYPDGVAAALLGKILRKPVVITARGTDINLIPRYLLPRKMIVWAASEARAVITVCKALKDSMVELGVSDRKITVLRNGVDLAFFHPPVDRDQLRASLGFSGTTLLSVGYLIERKGHALVINAIKDFPHINLWIIGEGPERKALTDLASRLGIADRIQMPGAVSQDELVRYYGAADALVLASSREGWANVLLESLACGTPVVATPVWGTPEIVAAKEAGYLTANRTSEAIAASINNLLSNLPSRNETRRYAEMFSWNDTTYGQKKIFESIRDIKISEHL